MSDKGLSDQERKDKQAGREAYRDGTPIHTLELVMEGAGWLECAMRDPNSVMNMTDVQMENSRPVMNLKPNAIFPIITKRGRGRPRGSKDTCMRKARAIRKIFI